MTLEPSYVAGVFDSDGSFSVGYIRKIHHYRPQVKLAWRVTNETLAVMAELKALYGGWIRTVEKPVSNLKNASPMVWWQPNISGMRKMLEDIIPFLRVKKRQAEIVYELASSRSRGRLTKLPLEQLETLYREIRILNAKGKGKGMRR